MKQRKIKRIIRSKKELDDIYSDIISQIENGAEIELNLYTDEKRRTDLQNNSLHKWFTETADILNASGLTIQIILSKAVAREWDKDSVKKLIFQSVYQHMTEKTSTAKADTKELTKVIEVLQGHFAQKFGVALTDFPSQERMSMDQFMSEMNNEFGVRV